MTLSWNSDPDIDGSADANNININTSTINQH
jgi:hypothetical protein